MHFTTKLYIKRWFAVLLISLKIIEALNYADFGLPNNYTSCILTFNQTIYILNQQSLTIKFSHPWSNTIAPQISRIGYNFTTSIDSCSITSSGKVILLPTLNQQQPLQVLDDINLPWILNNNITYLGSQKAIDLFITKTLPISTQFALTSFNDYIIFYNGNQTFSLDTRYKTLWTFYEVPHSIISSINHTPLLYTTSRWVLSFRKEKYTILVDCFDPYSFEWLGNILNFNTTFDARYTILAVLPVVSSAATTIASDSLLIVVAGTQGTTNNHAEASATGFWKLDISTSSSNNFTLTKLNPTIHQSDVAVFMTDLEDDGHSGSVVVTRLDDEMTLFYGGAKQLQFLNTTTLTFSPQPQWLTTSITNTTDDSNNTTKTIQMDNYQSTSNHRLAIILGTVLGGIFFIFVAVFLFWCCRRNKVLLRLNENKERNISSSSKNKKDLLLSRTEKPNRAGEEINNARSLEESPTISQFTLSPIAPLSPINLFPLPSDNPQPSISTTTEGDEAIIVQPKPKLLKSRFQELFYYNAYPPSRSTQFPNT